MTEEKQEAKTEEKTEEKVEKKTEEKKEEKPKETKSKVNYVHAALLLHSAGKEISESSLKKVIESAGVKADDAQVKSLVASLEGVDIQDAISQAVAAPAAATAAAPADEKKEEKKEENVEKKAEEAAAGLSSLFG